MKKNTFSQSKFPQAAKNIKPSIIAMETAVPIASHFMAREENTRFMTTLIHKKKGNKIREVIALCRMIEKAWKAPCVIPEFSAKTKAISADSARQAVAEIHVLCRVSQKSSAQKLKYGETGK